MNVERCYHSIDYHPTSINRLISGKEKAQWEKESYVCTMSNKVKKERKRVETVIVTRGTTRQRRKVMG